MSNLIEAAPEDPGGGAGGSNRPFVLIALALATLLVIGLVLILGYAAGTRLGLFGSRALASPDAAAVASAAQGTATALALSGATLAPAAATAAANGTRVPGAAATAATTSAPGATTAANGTRAPAVTAAAGGTASAPGAGTAAPTATPTRVVNAPTSTPPPPATNVPGGSALATATSTLVGGAALATATSTLSAVVASGPGGAGDSTAKAPPAGSNSNLPGTGVELDILLMAGLMLVVLVLARVFRWRLDR